jgi:transposase-like protein
VAQGRRPPSSQAAQAWPEFIDEAENDVLAYMPFPSDHWPNIHSTNGLERLNGEIKRRTEPPSD